MSDGDEIPVLTSKDAATFLRLKTVGAFYQMRRRLRQPRGFRLGRQLLFTRVELERLLQKTQAKANKVPFEELTPRPRKGKA
jgi:hypothetical protein